MLDSLSSSFTNPAGVRITISSLNTVSNVRGHLLGDGGANGYQFIGVQGRDLTPDDGRVQQLTDAERDAMKVRLRQNQLAGGGGNDFLSKRDDALSAYILSQLVKQVISAFSGTVDSGLDKEVRNEVTKQTVSGFVTGVETLTGLTLPFKKVVVTAGTGAFVPRSTGSYAENQLTNQLERDNARLAELTGSDAKSKAERDALLKEVTAIKYLLSILPVWTQDP